MTTPLSATLALNEYINTQLVSNSLIQQSFVPGSFGKIGIGDNYIVYDILPSTGTSFWMIHTDSFKYIIYNNDFQILQNIVAIINSSINVDIFQGLIVEPGIKYLFAHVMPSGSSENIYIEGNNYYTLTLLGSIIYTIP